MNIDFKKANKNDV